MLLEKVHIPKYVYINKGVLFNCHLFYVQLFVLLYTSYLEITNNERFSHTHTHTYDFISLHILYRHR